MKWSFRASTFSRLWTFRPGTFTGRSHSVVVGRTAAGQVVPTGVKVAGQVACPWGAAMSQVYIEGTSQGENYA
jgi:hypothetical protein